MKYCRKCGSVSKVYDSRMKHGYLVRYRRCQKCYHTWKTIEVDYNEYMRMKDEKDAAGL